MRTIVFVSVVLAAVASAAPPTTYQDQAYAASPQSNQWFSNFRKFSFPKPNFGAFPQRLQQFNFNPFSKFGKPSQSQKPNANCDHVGHSATAQPTGAPTGGNNQELVSTITPTNPAGDVTPVVASDAVEASKVPAPTVNQENELSPTVEVTEDKTATVAQEVVGEEVAPVVNENVEESKLQTTTENQVTEIPAAVPTTVEEAATTTA